MNLDLVVLGLVAVFAVLGALAGGVMQLSHVAAVAAGGLAARPLGIQFGAKAAEMGKVAPVVGVLGVTVLSFVVIYALVQVIFRVILKRVVQSPGLGTADRTLGFLLGAGKTLLILFVLLSAFLFFEKPLASVSPTLRFDTKGSHVADFVRAHNLFTNFSFPGVKGLATLARAGTDPAAAAKLGESPEFAALLKNPQIKSILGDSSLQKSLQGGDLISALKNTKVMEALTNTQLQSQLATLGEVSLADAPEKASKN